MNSSYTHFNNITKEILDTVGINDLIKINDWDRPMRVKAVSENFFVMTDFPYYSICSKRPWEGTAHNSMVGGMFHCGPDFWIWGAPLCYEDLYEFKNEQANREYLELFESGESELSERHSVPIYDLYVKKGK